MDGEYGERERRMGSLLVIGDAVIEAMSPSAEPEAAAMPIGRFQARFGRHWHSVAWFCDDARQEWDLNAGLRHPCPPAGGAHGPTAEEGDIYTHPKDTITQLSSSNLRPSTGSKGSRTVQGSAVQARLG